MKSLTLALTFIFTCCVASAKDQTNVGNLEISGKFIKLPKVNGVNTIIFDSITDATTIDCSLANSHFYEYNNLTSTFLLPPKDLTGYILSINGTNTDTIFVIDYSKHKSTPSLCQIADEIDACNSLTLDLNHTSDELFLLSPEGIKTKIQREFTLRYKTKSLNSTQWNDSIAEYKAIKNLPSQVTVDAPLCDTEFVLSGDQFGNVFGMSDSIKSPWYSAVSVKCHPTSITTTRNPDATNEENGPTDSKQLTGSGPMDILFQSNANEPVTAYYNWEVYKNNKLLITRADKEHRYTFSESGTYKIKITVSNKKCSYSDSLTVEISESALYVPNVFTPNGDGMNDEFRVAYKSIISFQAWIYNRWGRKIFSWNDPTKGWNGKIGGKDATPGAYFYVIKAVGSDKKEYNKKGDINLLR